MGYLGEDDDSQYNEDFEAAFAEHLQSAVSSFLAERGAIIQNVVCIVDFIGDDGQMHWTIPTPGEQFTNHNIALAEHMLAWFLMVRDVNFRDMLRKMYDGD